MIVLRKVTLIVMLAASLAVLGLAAYLLWDYQESLSSSAVSQNGIDARTRALGEKVEVLTRRVEDAELLVLILLGASGLYAIVFALSSLANTMGFARQADESIAGIRDQLSAARSERRELQEEARKAAQRQPQAMEHAAEQLREHVRAVVREELAESGAKSESLEANLDAIVRKIAGWKSAELDSQSRLELLHYESAAAYLELGGKPQLAVALAGLYYRFGQLYSSVDRARQRFYLSRALALAPPGSRLSSDIHYDLACCFAEMRDFSHALGELALAFQYQSKSLDDRLAQDIEQGGRLYELASTPPFDKELNDLLLNMSIGIS